MESNPDIRVRDDAVPPVAQIPELTGRPGHTVTSILIMGLISAAVLYAVDWSVETPVSVVYSWDFRAVSPTTTPWAFPGIGKEQDGNGVISLATETGPGPELIRELDTSEVGSVRIELEAYRFSDDSPLPITLEWYWASEEDIAAAEGKWPYSTERGTTLHIEDLHTPTTHSVDVRKHERWTGVVSRCFIGLKFPPNEPGPFKVRTMKIEFLE